MPFPLVQNGANSFSKIGESVACPRFLWGFDKSYGGTWQGDQDIRDALKDAGKAANGIAHRVLSREFISFVEGKNIETLPGWYCHDLRVLAMSLLANQNCGEPDADTLAVLYDRINAASHLQR